MNIKTLINKFAYEIECLHHGTPSGIDNTIACNGGLLFYKKLLD